MRSIPDQLAHRPFSVSEALDCGISVDMLRGRRFQRLFRGIYVVSDLELTYVQWLRAALLTLPKDAVVSHLSALMLWGFDARRSASLAFSTNTPLVCELPGVTLHRRRERLSPTTLLGLSVTGPDRTFVDCATELSFVQLVQVGDWLLHQGLSTPARLSRYCQDRRLSGVRKARRALAYVRPGAESPMETLVRLMLGLAGLPWPDCNVNVRDAAGRFVARVDMLYAEFLVIVEYDGLQHERDPRQRQQDRERREELEALGFRVIVITAEDLRRPRDIPRRVFAALEARGYDGVPPRMDVSWHQEFAAPRSI